MKTYLNELHQQCKENHSTNYTSLPSSNKKDEKLYNSNSNNSKNKLTKYKSGLFCNNYFRNTNINTQKIKDKSNKQSSSCINNIKTAKKKKKINVTPYQGIKNEYLLNLAMDNLNKYQEDILLKGGEEEKWKDNNINFIDNNIEILNANNNNNLNLLNNNNILIDKNKDKRNKTMNNLQEKFLSNNKIYNDKYNVSLINKEKRNSNNSNNYYNEFFVGDDLFTDVNNVKNAQYNDGTKFESYTNKKIYNNKSYIYFNNTNDKNRNNLNNINYEKKYEDKNNIFKDKSLDLKKKYSKNNNNKKMIDDKLIFILDNLELNELIKIFEKNYIFFDDLFLLSKDDFVEMKIPIGPRNRIINFLEKFKSYAKTYDLEELSFFMKKYKNIFINSQDNTDILNFNITPLTNNKYKSITTSDNNKNKESFDSRQSDFPGKRLNMSNFEEIDSINLRDEESKRLNNRIYFNSKNKDININNNEKKNKLIKDINKVINNKNENENDNNGIINNEEEKKNQYIDNNMNSNLNSTLRTNNNNKYISSDNYFEDNKNIFSNSLFKDFGTNINNNNEIKTKNNIYKDNNLNNSCENENTKININNLISTQSSKTKDKVFFNNSTDRYDSPSLNFLNNKLNNNNKTQNVYKNFQNIFSEIENYQINYEKMKRENDTRNNKINNLLSKKTNVQYLKMKIKNSKYYNEEDLKNESLRDLKTELQKMNFQKENDNNHLNSIKYNPPIQSYLKKKNNEKNNNNPLIQEFNKNK